MKRETAPTKAALPAQPASPVDAETARPADVVRMPKGTDTPKWVDPKPPMSAEMRRIVDKTIASGKAGNQSALESVGATYAIYKPIFSNLMDQGERFTRGRKPGTIGPVRKFIRAALKKNHSVTNLEIWNDIKSHPPRRWSPMENAQGRYIEGPRADDNVGWGRFRNIAAEERKRLSISRVSEGVKGS